MLLPMKTSWPALLALLIGFSACSTAGDKPLAGEFASGEDLQARVRRLLAEVPLIDGHNDLAWRLRKIRSLDFQKFDIGRRNKEGHTDIPRLREGGVGGQFWSVYVPVTMKGDAAVRATMEQIDVVHRMVRQHADVFELASTADDVVRIHRSGKIASMMGMEGGHSIADSLAALRMFHRLGVGYMTLTHMENTSWADSATDAPEVGGLNDFGKEVVRQMNRIGMLVDISHVSAETMHDTLDVTEAPVIFSHSSARAITDHPRNVPDDVLRRLPENGGVVMITFVPSYVSTVAGDYGARQVAERIRVTRKFGKGDPRIGNALRVWSIKNPAPKATLADVVAHIEHVKEVAGVDHVGLGGDFDGIVQVVEGLEDVSKYGDLVGELLRRGWTDGEVRKLLGENLLRVMRAAETCARRYR